MRNAYKDLGGRAEGMKLLRRPRRRWEDNIKIDLKERLLECVRWFHLAEDNDLWRAVVDTVMNLRVS
jgi:hypothetical protein